MLLPSSQATSPPLSLKCLIEHRSSCKSQGEPSSIVRPSAGESRFPQEGIIEARLRLGDLLVRAKLVTTEEVAEALQRQAVTAGRLGDTLVAMGVIRHEVLDAFLRRIPAEPTDIAATGIDENELLSLMMKLIYTSHLQSIRQFAEAIKLPFSIVQELVQMAVDRQLLITLGSRQSGNLFDMSYMLTDKGRTWVLDAVQRLGYIGPAPVTLKEFSDQVNVQKVTNERVTFERIRKAFGDLDIEDAIIEQSGPALTSGRAMLLYGPPGNGKTSLALRFASVFNDVIYVPYAVSVDGQIICVFDPSLHIPLNPTDLSEEDAMTIFRREEYDARWVACRRPFVVTGGELTLSMLDLRYDPNGHFYEAPLHVKALGGCFIIDDFGRQLVSPTELLNRWIVPLESRVDYLKLHTGKTFSIPFEEMVIFSTNIEPEDLMDPAFLRRLPYKIEVGAPSMALFHRIFEKESARQGLTLTKEIFEAIVYTLKVEKGIDFAAFQPRFIIDQVVASCRFMGQAPHFEPRFIDYAVNNLHVRRSSAPKPTAPAPVQSARG